MKLNKLIISVLLGISLTSLRAMEWEPPKEEEPVEPITMDPEYKKLLIRFQQQPRPLQEIILKALLTGDPEKIEKGLKKLLTGDREKIEEGIKYLQALSSLIKMPLIREVINDPKFIDWARKTIAGTFNIDGIDAAIKLRLPGAANWLRSWMGYPKVKKIIDKKLIDAVEIGSLGMARFLLDLGVDINTVDIHGETALMFATRKGDKEMVKLLLDRGAKINKKNKIGLTPLMLAVTKNDKEMVQLLLDRGAKIAIKNIFGNTPLKIAIELGHKEIKDLLIKKLEEKLNINIQVLKE